MSFESLKMNKAEASELLEKQINKGILLSTEGYSLIEEQNGHNISPRERDLFQSTFTQWVGFTYSMLLRVFTSSKYASEFEAKHSSKVEYVNSSWVPDIQYYLTKQITPKLDYLKLLLKSIDDFIEEDSQPAPAKGNEKSQLYFGNFVYNSDTVWQDIEKEYGINKKSLGKQIAFVKDSYKRKIVFRDIEHAFLLANVGLSKPAVIIAGGVIEELLRIYLEAKAIKSKRKDFDSYIKACQDNGLLMNAINKLADSVRHFRNTVHLEKETSSRHSISKSMAKGAVASIFTVVSQFEKII
jgi:hypothetical protein